MSTFDLLSVPIKWKMYMYISLAYKMGNVPLPHVAGRMGIDYYWASIYSTELLFRKTYGEIINPAFRAGLELQKKL